MRGRPDGGDVCSGTGEPLFSNMPTRLLTAPGGCRPVDGSRGLLFCTMCFFFTLSVIPALMGLLSPLAINVPPSDEGRTSSVKYWERSAKLMHFI